MSVNIQQPKIWLKRLALLCIGLLFHVKKAGTTALFAAMNENDIHSVLLVETAFLGDVVATTPLLRKIKKQWPAARIDILVERKNSPLLQFEKSIYRLLSFNSRQLSALMKIIPAMRRNSYDLVVCASPGVRNSLIALLSGKRFISGYLVHNAWNTSFFNDFHAVMIGSDRTNLHPKRAHLIERALNALAPLNLYPDPADTSPRLYLSPTVEREKSRLLHAGRFLRSGKINLVIHPGASSTCKQWPRNNMILLIRQLFRHYPDALHITLIGLTVEKSILEKIEQQVPRRIMLLIGAELLTVMTLIKQATVFLGNDSGPKHIADAFEKPLVELLGPSLPETVGGKNPAAYSVYAGAECSPCSHLRCGNDGRCMKNIRMEAVLRPLYSIIDEQLKRSRK